MNLSKVARVIESLAEGGVHKLSESFKFAAVESSTYQKHDLAMGRDK
jgi:hypothetical protein